VPRSPKPLFSDVDFVDPPRHHLLHRRPHVAEPPQLYGPHAPVIIPKASDGYTCVTDNLKVCRVFSGNPNHPRSSEQDHITEALQYYNSLYNKLHQSKNVKDLCNISLQTIYSKPYTS
jgi:hypothetical protein